LTLRGFGDTITAVTFVLYLLILSGALCSAAAQPFGPSQLSYVLEPVVIKGRLRLHVDLYFQGSETGWDALVLPDSGAGQKELYKAVRGLRVVTPGARLYEKSVSHKPSEMVHLRYEIFQDWKGPIKDEIYYRPILDPAYFHFFGGGIFVHPDWKTDVARKITLSWKNIPKGWTIANSFGANQAVQDFQSSIDKFNQAVYVGGDFRVYGLEIKGRPLSIAMRGRWLFSDPDFTRLAGKIVRAGRDFWEDHEFPYFLITLLPTDEPCCDLGGTGLTNAFALFVSSGVDIGMGKLEYTLAHELFHAWNGIKIRRQEPDELLYWFSEGFTVYYTSLLNLRAGLITLNEHVSKYNEVISRYYASPVRNEDNERIRKDFWNDSYVEKLPYQRGAILAHNWNAAIKRESGGHFSLDDVMRDLLRAALSQGTRVSPRGLDSLMRIAVRLTDDRLS
jgi:predicted metalloprotease with PDZ domain